MLHIVCCRRKTQGHYVPAIFAPVAIVVSTGAMAAFSVAGSSLQPERINVAKKNPMRESFSNGCLNVLMSLVPYFFDSLGRDKARWVFVFCLYGTGWI